MTGFFAPFRKGKLKNEEKEKFMIKLEAWSKVQKGHQVTLFCYRKTKKAMYSVTKGIAMPETRATRLEDRMAGIRP